MENHFLLNYSLLCNCTFNQYSIQINQHQTINKYPTVLNTFSEEKNPNSMMIFFPLQNFLIVTWIKLYLCNFVNTSFISIFAQRVRERERERMTSLLQQMPVRLVTVFTSGIMIHCYQLLIFLTGTWILSVKISSECCSSILPNQLIQTPLNLGNTTKP